MYNYVNSRIGYRQAIGTLFDADGNAVLSKHDKANMFNKYFSSMCIMDNGHLPVCGSFALHSILDTVTFTEVERWFTK